MGAFHQGHLELMRAAKASRGHCTVSLFINPAQFGPQEDLSRYPRREEVDFQKAQESGVDVMFCPSSEEVYHGPKFSIDPGPIASLYEGAARPGHFAGVCLVVLKLFLLVQPKVAYFGRKDLQQCAVIDQMVRAFDVPVSLAFLETIREDSGLAMSSRNDYLSPHDRLKAATFPKRLREACGAAAQGMPPQAAAQSAAEALVLDGFEVDYCAAVHEATLAPIDEIEEGGRMMAAIRFAGIRLLDNMPIVPKDS
jgi:pantoate--beta-alanine ligase